MDAHHERANNRQKNPVSDEGHLFGFPPQQDPSSPFRPPPLDVQYAAGTGIGVLSAHSDIDPETMRAFAELDVFPASPAFSDLSFLDYDQPLGFDPQIGTWVPSPSIYGRSETPGMPIPEEEDVDMEPSPDPPAHTPRGPSKLTVRTDAPVVPLVHPAAEFVLSMGPRVRPDPLCFLHQHLLTHTLVNPDDITPPDFTLLNMVQTGYRADDKAFADAVRAMHEQTGMFKPISEQLGYLGDCIFPLESAMEDRSIRHNQSVETIICRVVHALRNGPLTREELVQKTKFERRRLSSALGPFKGAWLLAETTEQSKRATIKLGRNYRLEAVSFQISEYIRYFHRLVETVTRLEAEAQALADELDLTLPKTHKKVERRWEASPSLGPAEVPAELDSPIPSPTDDDMLGALGMQFVLPLVSFFSFGGNCDSTQATLTGTAVVGGIVQQHRLSRI
ncbi:hypothetical protein J8273_0073 [Carpediemonas membranifera]|uniref:Uncharacterized protein n=1 Tax=Carpediemonas membranifera TaxID=201153 RepID=A0A8J6BYU0_9EUKA|nr:hypothetical protein J8273_0073 [Carpediemonas membranifera]|eukprot:KAG9394866.1 hypothetical protein J8273_0073 [Carpediemonas membranifera]